MNKKEQADALVEKFYNLFPTEPHKAINYAIISVEHTIEVLGQMDNEIYNIEPYINEQTELLNELKSR